MAIGKAASHCTIKVYRYTIWHMTDQDEKIHLSQITQALLTSLDIKSPPNKTVEGENYHVSQTVSLFGFVYERIRNAIEFNEEHLIRRIAITRILRRRLAINTSGDHEGENLVRELLWGRYVPENHFSATDIQNIQHIIDRYIAFYRAIHTSLTAGKTIHLGAVITELLSCALEEYISGSQTQRESASLYFFYQTLRNKVNIPHVSDEARDEYFFVASERALARNDNSFILHHIMVLKYGDIVSLTDKELSRAASEFPTFLKRSYATIKNPYDDVLTRFAKKQVPPFKILYAILTEYNKNASHILSNTSQLQKYVQTVCNLKYKQTSEKLRAAAVKSIIYIFLTKMLFVLILEIPLSRLLLDHVDIIAITINTFFPPVLMSIIVSVITPPSQSNTQRIYERIVDLIDKDPTYETQPIIITRSRTSQKPILFMFFSLLYLLTFSVVFGVIYSALDAMGFNIVSKLIFIFFISVVAFFGYRIRQTAKEYMLETQSNIITSAVTFLFLPILYLGKLLSDQVSRINVFIIFFDYFIEAPFKFFIDIVEEWARFLRDRKDELVN